jgi:ABC-type transporter Mla subunit MlaD
LMSEDDRQRQMDFILKQQAAFSSELIDLKTNVDRTSGNVDRLATNLDRLVGAVQQHADGMRQAIENLIIANEATRDLANKAAELAINVSQRLTEHEREHD